MWLLTIVRNSFYDLGEGEPVQPPGFHAETPTGETAAIRYDRLGHAAARSRSAADGAYRQPDSWHA